MYLLLIALVHDRIFCAIFLFDFSIASIIFTQFFFLDFCLKFSVSFSSKNLILKNFQRLAPISQWRCVNEIANNWLSSLREAKVHGKQRESENTSKMYLFPFEWPAFDKCKAQILYSPLHWMMALHVKWPPFPPEPDDTSNNKIRRCFRNF